MEDVVAPGSVINDDLDMVWVSWMGICIVIVALAVWSWVSRERDVQPDHGTISVKWRNEQRANDRETRDR